MLNPSDQVRAEERLKRLHLMGFTKDEQKSVIEVEFATKLTTLEFEALYSGMRASLTEMPDLPQIKEAFGEAQARARVIQSDLLGIYHSMLRNFNAQQRGLREHEEPGPHGPEPVIAVRPSEIVAVGDKIIKIDQELFMGQVNVAKLLQVAPPSTSGPHGPAALPGSNPAALMAALADEVDDGDFTPSE